MKTLTTATISILIVVIYLNKNFFLYKDSPLDTGNITPVYKPSPNAKNIVLAKTHNNPPPPVEPTQPIHEALLEKSINQTDKRKQAQTDFSNIFDFIAYFENSDISNIDIIRVVDFVNLSSEAFEYIKSSFRQENSRELRQVILHILDSSHDTQKVDIALELTDSKSVSERKMSYAWLSQATAADTAIAREALINAIETEEDTDLLIDLMSLVVIKDNAQQYSDRTVNRVKDLSFHDDESVSTHAILTLGEMEKNQEILDFLVSHMENSPQHLQLAAINSLKLFDYPDDSAMSSLNRIISNPSMPQTVRAHAVSAIVAFENYAANSKVNSGNFKF